MKTVASGAVRPHSTRHRLRADRWLSLLEAGAVAMEAVRMTRNGRYRAGVVIVASWAGAQLGAGALRLLRQPIRGAGTADPTLGMDAAVGAGAVAGAGVGAVAAVGVGVAYGLGRIAPPWRIPLLAVSGAIQMVHAGDFHQVARRARRWLTGLAGAKLAVAMAEMLTVGGRAVGREVAVVVNTTSGSPHLARRAVRALRRQPVRIVGVHRTPGGGLSAAFDQALASLRPGGILAVAGGDGTVGFGAGRATQADRALAILPTGTGNDVARSLRLPLCPEEAAALVAEGEVGRMDLGRTDDQTFAHAATIGMTAEFADRVRDIKGWRRPLRYPIVAWQAWRTRQELRVEVLVDGQPMAFLEPPFQLAVMSAPRIGGRVGMSLPATAPDDGLLHIVVADRRSLRHALNTQVGFLHSRATRTLPGTTIHHGKVVEIRSQAHLLVSLDGEPSEHTPLVIRIDPQACQVIRPRVRSTRQS
ncbi:MAG: hypothetical protein M3083_20925 [Actinomycetota bacterium]|nr:hypothetical protein [Actinomycetota bacterium]